MKIVINLVPPSMNRFNGRKNVHEYRELKRNWTQAIWALCLASKELPSKPYEKALVRIDYYFANATRRDADNYSGKLFLDGLTHAGVIVDDSFKHISVSIHGHVDKKNSRTEISITPIIGE